MTSVPEADGSFPDRPWWEDDPTGVDPADVEFPRRRRPRAVRLLALLLAVALAAAAIGTGIEVLLAGDGSSAVAARVVSVGPGPTAGHEQVTLELTGPTSGSVTCAVEVASAGSSVAAGDVVVPTLRQGATRIRVRFPVTGSLSAPSARVACRS